MNLAPAIATPVPNIAEKIRIGTNDFLSLEMVVSITGIAVNSLIINYLI